MDIEKHIAEIEKLAAKPLFSRKYYQPDVSKNHYEPIFSNYLTSASAAMTQLLPKMSADEQEAQLTRLAYHLALQRLEEGVDLRPITRIEGNPDLILSDGPKIICTFHYGSFRYLPYFMLLEKKPFAMLLTESAIKEQGQRYLRLREASDKALGATTVINAQSWISVIKCLKYLQSGGSVLAYIDGNSGVEGEVLHTDHRMLPIPFLGGEIFVRHGICLLSHLSRIPITVVINDIRSTADRVLKIYDPIACESRADAGMAMTRIFGLLEEHLRNDVSQWEGWIYYRTYIRPAERRTDTAAESPAENYDGKAPLYFNHEKYGVLRHPDRTELIDKETLTTRRLNAAVASLLDEIIYSDSPWTMEQSGQDPSSLPRILARLLQYAIVRDRPAQSLPAGDD